MRRKKNPKKTVQESDSTEVSVKHTSNEPFDNIIETPRSEEQLELRDSGALQLKERKPRKPKYPRIGQEELLPFRKVIIPEPPAREVKKQVIMGVENLILKGIKGVAEGEIFYIHYGEEVTIGRGHECNISYRHFQKYQADQSQDKNFLAVSRQHLRIAFFNTHSVELKDLSSNGTYLNGKRIDKRVFITHIATSKTPYEIKLGPTETFLLTAETEEPAVGKDSE